MPVTKNTTKKKTAGLKVKAKGKAKATKRASGVKRKRSTARRRPKLTGANGTRGAPLYKLSESLAKICNVDLSTRPQVVKRIWAYATLNNLSQGDLIVCDGLLKDCFDTKVLTAKSIFEKIGSQLTHVNGCKVPTNFAAQCPGPVLNQSRDQTNDLRFSGSDDEVLAPQQTAPGRDYVKASIIKTEFPQVEPTGGRRASVAVPTTVLGEEMPAQPRPVCKEEDSTPIPQTVACPFLPHGGTLVSQVFGRDTTVCAHVPSVPCLKAQDTVIRKSKSIMPRVAKPQTKAPTSAPLVSIGKPSVVDHFNGCGYRPQSKPSLQVSPKR